MDKSEMINALANHYSNGKLKDFASFLGVAQNTISNWKTRGTIDYELVFTKCEGLSASWLLSGGLGKMINKEKSPDGVPGQSEGGGQSSIINSGLTDNVLKLILQEQHVIRELLVDVLTGKRNVPESKIFERIDNIRREFQEEGA